MLYITTRQNRDVYTAVKALNDVQTPDEGLYVPYSLPVFDQQLLAQITACSFGETVAHILNLFFPGQLTGWDVDVVAGRSPLKLIGVGRKTVMVQTWHNPGYSFDYVLESIYDKLDGAQQAQPKGWAVIAIRIAYLFAAYGELLRQGLISPEHGFNISVPVGDFTELVSAFYARSMGLSVDKIIICSDESSALWDLIHRDELNTSLLKPEQRRDMERLIYCVLGHDEVEAYKAACDRHGVYLVPEEKCQAFAAFSFGAVIGKDRIGSVISSVSQSNGVMLTPVTAVCYAGVQDFRSKTGQSNLTVLFAHHDRT